MNAGYDVWLANSRGNEESRDHEFFLPDDDRYWDFTLDEMGRYDVKSIIDKVLKVSNKPNLFYVGHSLGTMLFYIFMHYHADDYTNKIKGMVAMPPSAYLTNSETALLLLGALEPIYAPVGIPLNTKFPPFTQLIHRILPGVCNINLTDDNACSYLLDVVGGKTADDTEPEAVKRYVEHFPNGLSAKALIHLLQLTRDDRFGMYNHGPAKNVLLYSQPAPPTYNLFGIDVQTFNIYGLQDLIVDRTDAERTVAALGTTKGKTNLLIQEFNHIDLILSNFAAPVINSRILRFFDAVEQSTSTRNVCCSCRRDEKKVCKTGQNANPNPINAPIRPTRLSTRKPVLLSRKSSGKAAHPNQDYFSTSFAFSPSVKSSSYFKKFMK